jgi:asparagine synthase (glutamine-hydrolysing)
MCGIAGIVNLSPTVGPPDRGLVNRMTDVLTHRGPDDRGVWLDDRVALGHRRLSIIDLSTHGRQPMSNEDGSVQITYNGEVYNFADLKDRYTLARRHAFRSRTDTEVLVHLYEEFGIDMLTELNGMFAFALWDARRQELFLARDPYGIKPLFYTRQGQRLLFASEIKSLLQDPAVPRRVNLQALHDFLTFDYIPGAQTAFADIFELPPAHVLKVDAKGEVTIRRYRDLSYEVDDRITEKQAAPEILELMASAVKRQLVADVPVGVMLSGGLDSSTLVALMSRQTSEPLHTYSVGFDDSSFNELPYARIVAETFKTIQREIVVTPQLVRDMLPKYLSYIDEPYADGSAIPTYYVCQLAKDEVVVVLSGEGGDEAFAGYDTHAAYQASLWAKRVPQWIRHRLIAPVVNLLPTSDKKLSLEFKLKRFLGGLDLEPAQAHVWWRIVLTEAQKLELYSPEVLEQLRPEPPERHALDVYNRSNAKHVLNRLLHIDSAVFLPDDLMIKNDRMSMAHSLEARVPFTDLELTDYMSRVPPDLKLKGLRKKHIMRKALAGFLPPAILNKKKVGLEMPYSRWLRSELKDLLLAYCEPSRIADTGLFSPAGVNALVNQHLSGRLDHGRALWGLLNYLMWLELYIPNPGAGVSQPQPEDLYEHATA